MASPKLAPVAVEFFNSSQLWANLQPRLTSRRLWFKLMLLLGVSIVIGGLLSPRLVFQPVIYLEGDVIRGNVVIPEDMLLPDRVSTDLKANKLVSELGAVYDFDPQLFANTLSRIATSFDTARKERERLADLGKMAAKKRHDLGLRLFVLRQDIQETDKKLLLYTQFWTLTKKRLSDLIVGEKLNEADFLRKSKLDQDLFTIGNLINDLKEKKSRYQNDLKAYPQTTARGEKELADDLVELEKQKQLLVLSFFKALNIEFTDAEAQSALSFDFSDPSIDKALIELMTGLQDRQIIASKHELSSVEGKVVLRNLLTGGDEPFQNVAQFTGIEEAKDLARQRGSELFLDDETGKKRNFVILLAQRLLRPTVTLNKQEFENRKEKLVQNMSPVFFSVKKGEVIARAGDRATRHQVDLIQSYFDEMQKADKLPKLLGMFLIAFFSLTLIYFVLQLKGREQFSFKSLLLMSLVIVFTLFLIKGGMIVAETVSMRYTEIDLEVFRYVYPSVLCSMLIGILLGFDAAILTGLLTSLFVTMMIQGNLYFFFYAMIGSLVASLPMTKFDNRHSLLNHGLKVSAVNLPVLVILLLIEKNEIGAWSLPFFAAGALSGVLASVLASVLLPLLETAFDLTTNLRLLELSNMNHPALKGLIFNAPGTYQHSIVVGNLAESAASKIGANPLMARVGAYYHDLGKGDESHYFIENQPQNSKNIHDEMDPYVSAKKIIGHLTLGEEIADRFRLGQRIKDMIRQHHGTGLVKFFYNKALSAAGETEVDANQFRYPGPKPQSLEAALLMLADAAEASTRSIITPTEAKVKAMVEKVGWAILEDGQLDESGMTLEHFRATIDCFYQVLCSIHHHRIQYPEEVGLVTNRSRVTY